MASGNQNSGDMGAVRRRCPQRVSPARAAHRHPARRPSTVSVEDDTNNALLMEREGLVYAGRSPFGRDHVENHEMLRTSMSDAKFTLAFSNTSAPSADTHPTYEYLTGRWLDSLAVGTSVIGVAPRCRSTDDLLWPQATIELGTTNREEGMDIIADAVRSWTPERPAMNHLRALERIDWRWRFAEVATALGLRPPRLQSEVEALRTRIRQLGGESR